MDCGHEQITIQDFNKKINDFKSTYTIAYFLINCLSLIKYKSWSYCFCVGEKKCELCIINGDFNNFEDVMGEDISDQNFLLEYQSKPYLYLRRLFFAKKSGCCCFLDKVYSFTYQLNGENFTRTFCLEEIIDEFVQNKLKK